MTEYEIKQLAALCDDAEAWGNGTKVAATEAETAYQRAQAEARVATYLAQVEAAEAAREEQRRANARYYGSTMRHYRTGTLHFVNSWGETFCGKLDEDLNYSGETRATCRTCVRAGDAVERDGTYSAGGSAARRH